MERSRSSQCGHQLSTSLWKGTKKKERKKGVLSASYFCVGEMPNWKMSKNDGGLVSLLHIAYRSMPRHEMRRTRTRNSFVGSTVFIIGECCCRCCNTNQRESRGDHAQFETTVPFHLTQRPK